MCELKATPGPWKTDANAGCKSIKGGKAGDHKQAQYTEIATTVGLHNEDEDRANAALIAAAPDLYEALEDVLAADWQDIASPDSDIWKQVNAALAKARGE